MDNLTEYIINNTISTKVKYKGASKYIHSSDAYKFNCASLTVTTLSDNNSIRDILIEFGYNQNKISDFINAYQEAVAGNSEWQKIQSHKTAAADDFKKLFKLAKEDFSGLVKIARIAFKKDEVKLSETGIAGKIRRDYAGVFNTMQTFYDNSLASPDISAALAIYGYTTAKLNLLRDKFIEARDAHNNSLKADAAAKLATLTKNAKIELMNQFMLELFTIGKIALGKNSDQLRLLGLD